MQSIRTWLNEREYLEVSTPTLSPDLIPEPTIQNFSSRLISEFLGERELYLIPSPEIHMKKIIGEIRRSIYQFSRCFRNSEQVGSLHNPEFTMLEYYTVDCDDESSIAITEELIGTTALPGCPKELLPPFRRMTVNEACTTYGNFDLDHLQDVGKLREKARSLGFSIEDRTESWEATFNRLFLNLVEPRLPQECPLVLCEYPMQIECLAKRKTGTFYRRRWELYAMGVEIANCYDEETDVQVIKDYYRRHYAMLASQRAPLHQVIPDVDEHFADYFGSSYPQCSGVALGFDRLLMLELGLDNLGGVILFPLSDIIL